MRRERERQGGGLGEGRNIDREKEGGEERERCFFGVCNAFNYICKYFEMFLIN